MLGRILSFSLLLLMCLGCATRPINYSEIAEGEWTAKALIRDTREGKSAVLHLDILAIKGEKVRIDATAVLGHPVAALVWQRDRLDYVLIEAKKFRTGPPTPAALKSVMGIALDPGLLQNILFDLPIEEKSWSCTTDKYGLLSECASPKEGIKMTWSDRHVRRKNVRIEAEHMSAQINFLTFQPKVEPRVDAFELRPPKGFSSIKN